MFKNLLLVQDILEGSAWICNFSLVFSLFDNFAGTMSQEGEKSDDQTREPALPRLQLKAVTDHLTRMMKDQMEEIHTRLDRVQEDQQNLSDARKEGSSKKGMSDEDDYYSHKSGSSKSSHRRPRRARETRGRFDDNLDGMKLKIPTFYGKNDPDAYLEWEKKIELVFDCQHFCETTKVRIAATEFTDYAINWWDQVVTNRRRTCETPLNTWQEMKFLMRKKFGHGHYHRDLHQKIRKLAQGNHNVED